MVGLRFLTAGESHGPAMTSILEGMPLGVPCSEEAISAQLARRQLGYGRGGRMKIEKDEVRLLSGVSGGRTTGGPITLQVVNKDYENWKDRPHQPVYRPRPGHGDLAGAIKYGLDDARLILERASARETVNRVAVGACARAILDSVGATVTGTVFQMGGQTFSGLTTELLHDPKQIDPDPEIEAQRRAFFQLVDEVRREGDTLGGVVEVCATGLPPGLGSHVQWDRRLDAELARALMSIPSVKGMAIGEGIEAANLRGSQVHDAIIPDEHGGSHRASNHAGGMEAGISNGEPIIVRVSFKPIATLRMGMPSINMQTGAAETSDYERSDVTVVPAAAVVAENVVAGVLTQAFLAKFGGDTLDEVRGAYDRFVKQCARTPAP